MSPVRDRAPRTNRRQGHGGRPAEKPREERSRIRETRTAMKRTRGLPNGGLWAFSMTGRQRRSLVSGLQVLYENLANRGGQEPSFSFPQIATNHLVCNMRRGLIRHRQYPRLIHLEVLQDGRYPCRLRRRKPRTGRSCWYHSQTTPLMIH